MYSEYEYGEIECTDDEATQKLIQQLLEEDKHQIEIDRKEQELLSLQAIQKLQDEESKFDEEAKFYEEQKRIEESESIEEQKRAEEENMPECKICFDQIEFKDVYPLSCGHIFHPYCLSPHIKAKVDEKNFPITCPD